MALSTAASQQNIILTFGYGNRKNYDALSEYIDGFGILFVVDVRLNPRAWTRKWYGDAIEKFCVAQKINYMSRGALGNTSGNSRWIPPVLEEANQSLREIALLLKKGNVLLMCAEMDPSRCHRVEVAEKLRELTNATVKHLA
jgi:uncharacterized protein (DUF488 family)